MGSHKNLGSSKKQYGGLNATYGHYAQLKNSVGQQGTEGLSITKWSDMVRGNRG